MFEEKLFTRIPQLKLSLEDVVYVQNALEELESQEAIPPWSTPCAMPKVYKDAIAHVSTPIINHIQPGLIRSCITEKART
jgi:hypothetical protein